MTSDQISQPTDPEDPEYLAAQKRVKKIKKYYKHLAEWAGVSLFMMGLDFFLSGGISWSKYPVFFWGITLVIQFFEILRLQKMDKAWERKQMERFTGRTLPEDTTVSTPLEDYSDELLNQKDREMANLSDYRKVNKPWKEEDLV
jgi:hypothetical protein